jgi:hypothetical protein
MIKLNGHKNSTISFDVDVKNLGREELKCYFRLVHEDIEYGFSVDLAEGKAKVIIPPLKDILSNITEDTIIEARLEFVGGGDHVQAWNDKAKIFLPPEVNAIVKEEVDDDKLQVAISEVEDDKIVTAKAALIENEKIKPVKTPKTPKKKLSMSSRFISVLDD